MRRNVDDMKQKEKDESQSTTHVGNGSADFRGRIADKRSTGGWKASPFIIVSVLAEKAAGFAIAVNMMAFWTAVMHYSLPNAVAITAALSGFVTTSSTILGAFLADAYWGRFNTILVFSCIQALGTLMLALQAGFDSLHPPACKPKAAAGQQACQQPTTAQIAFLLATRAVISVGSSGMKPSVGIFGADQFDETDVDKEVHQKSSFFNWFFLTINLGGFLAITFLVHLREYKGWVWGFAAPSALTFFSVLVFALGYAKYRYKTPLGSAITRFLQVAVASVRNHRRGVVKLGPEVQLYEVRTRESDIQGVSKLAHTEQFRMLDKAAVITTEHEEAITMDRWRLCTVTQVEELKSFLRIFPIWATTLAVFIPFSQIHSFFLGQAMIMDRRLGPKYSIPASTVPIFGLITVVVLVPIYDKLLVPLLRRYTGHPRGISSLQRIGVGLFLSVCSMLAAAVVEKMRRTQLPAVAPVFWLFPQFSLCGAAETFTFVGLMEFFYNQATDSTRSLSNAVFLTEMGVAGLLNSAIVKMVQKTTGWLTGDLNTSKLDRFYWILAAISIVNFSVYLLTAARFKGKEGGGASVRDVSALDQLAAQDEREEKSKERAVST